MKIHTNDEVVVIAGKDKGKKAKVLRAIPKENKLVIEGVNVVTRHMKKQGATPGQKVTYEKPIDASNVMIVDPKSGKPTRIGYKIENGKKVRIAKKSGAVL
ncbi:50S ribosomal protein L24 [Candidatus Gracilibacteria bacterium]|nr:50S ribosomal protein L24 [Candidatus Gracilibacteria bacterium]